jgi:hypothetical protein
MSSNSRSRPAAPRSLTLDASQHLAVLRTEDIVRTRREAQTIHFGLAEGPALRVIQALHDIYCGRGRTSPG